MVGNGFVRGGELGALPSARFVIAEDSADWLQMPLGAVEIGSGILKTAVPIRSTELDRMKRPEKTQLDSALPSDCELPEPSSW